MHVVTQSAVLDRRPLGDTGGTGGVDDIRQVFWIDSSGGWFMLLFADNSPIEIESDTNSFMRRAKVVESRMG
jgi:hypothetical protein